MQLTSAHVHMFKCIEDSEVVPVDPSITVLVGQNESGKTAFLQALYKTVPVDKAVKYDVTEDYPRKALSQYERKHAADAPVVVDLTYRLVQDEIDRVNEALGYALLEELEVTVHHKYNGNRTINMGVPEVPYVQHLLKSAGLSSDVAQAASSAKTIRELIATLEAKDLNSEERAFLAELKQRFRIDATAWPNLLSYVVWTDHVDSRIPQFLYFDEYLFCQVR